LAPRIRHPLQRRDFVPSRRPVGIAREHVVGMPTAAAESKKPDHPSGDNRFKLLDRAINAHHGDGHSLIEVLHAAQGIFGYLEDDLLVYVARALKRPLSQVYGVATFYNYFRLKPPGKHTVVLCTGTACYVKGANAIQKELEPLCRNAGVSLVQARCIGSCGLAPVAVIDGEVAARLTPAAAVERVTAAAAKDVP
jgi:bidirectional [NiFe] hydrogenase diaphorase subunit